MPEKKSSPTQPSRWVDEFVLQETIKDTVIARVSAHGGGLYLYVPRDVIDVYGIMAGDKVEIQLLRHWKPAPIEGGKA